MSATFNGRIVKKTARQGNGIMVSIPTGEGNYVDTWLTVNKRTVLPEGVSTPNELFGKKLDIEIRTSGRTTFLNKASFSPAV